MKSSIKPVFYVVCLIFIVASGYGAYWYRDNQANEADENNKGIITEKDNKIANLEWLLAQAEHDTLVSNTDKICSESVSPSASAIENIKASITSGNTAALEGYMASSVNFVLAASEAFGEQTPTQAVSDITSFIGGATSPWDFDLSASVLSSYGKSEYYGSYFPNNAIVGRSADGKVISFSFDCNGKIRTVFEANHEEVIQ